jgi:DNA repair protein RecO
MSFKTEAFVLKVGPWREADRLYYLLTPREGVLKAVLKSAAKPGNKLAGHLLPFAKVRVMIGRGKIDHLAGVSVIRNFKNLKNDLHHLSLASSVVELFLAGELGGDKTTEFGLLEDMLTILDRPDVSLEKKLLLVRVFLWKFLSLSGWQPHLENCFLCQREIKAGQYVPGRGIICSEHEHSQAFRISAELINLLRLIIKADWPEIYNLEINKNLNKEWLKISQLFYQAVYDQPSQALKLFFYG